MDREDKCSPTEQNSKRSYTFVTPSFFPGDLSIGDWDPNKNGLKDAIQKAMDSHPNFNKLVRADTICQYFAKDNGLPGVYAAWLSAGEAHSVKSFLVGENVWADTNPRHFTLPDGTCVANSWDEWGSSNHLAAINQTPDGAPLNWFAWTGTNDDASHTKDHCNTWSSSSATETGRVGNTSFPASGWSNNHEVWCSTRLHLYCLQYAD
ncbi:MAG TPA: hypothetical protein PKW35_07955 [Nannocystaceae bacterium]|nr:hypothetical protein [Nannocystaceae bacterium]